MNNLQAILQHRELTIMDVVKLGAAKGLPVSNGTVGRMYEGRYVGLEKVADVARALGLQPWQILVPGLNPASLPKLGGEAAERALLEEQARRTKAAIDEIVSKKYETAPAPLEPRTKRPATKR